MFGNKKSNVQDDSIPPRLDLSEYLGLLFSFLWFHRGIVLAIVVLWGLYQAVSMATNKVAEDKRRDRQAPAFVYVPQPVENKSLTGDGFVEKDAPRRTPLPTEPIPLVKRPVKKPVKRQKDPKTVRFQKFLETADADSMMRRAKILLQEVPGLSPTEAVMNITRREQISKRMRQMDLTPEQLELLDIAEIESLSQLDAINIQHRMEIPDLRERLFQLATSLLNHPSVAVSAKAHLAIFAARGVDLLIDPKREELVVLTDAYQAHVEGIMKGSSETIVLAELLQTIVVTHQFDEVIALRRDVANRALNSDSSSIKTMDLVLQERIIFGDLELRSLISRMDDVSQTTYDDIDLFYERLEQFPETGPATYKLAVAVIGKYLMNDQFDEAARLVGWLQRMLPNIPDPEIQFWVTEGLTQYSEKIRVAQTAP